MKPPRSPARRAAGFPLLLLFPLLLGVEARIATGGPDDARAWTTPGFDMLLADPFPYPAGNISSPSK